MNYYHVDEARRARASALRGHRPGFRARSPRVVVVPAGSSVPARSDLVARLERALSRWPVFRTDGTEGMLREWLEQGQGARVDWYLRHCA